MSTQKNLTNGSVFNNIIKFSLPYLFSYFLQTLYGMADLYIVGQYDEVAGITSVSIGSQIMHMLTVMIVGLAMGSTVNIAQAVGGNDKKRVSNTIGNTAALFAGLSVVFTVLLILNVRFLVSTVSTPTEAVEGTRVYLMICFIGVPFITAYNIICSIFRGLGDSKSPMYFIAIACVVNIILDYIFVGFLHMGPAGAALATVISQAISVGISLVVIRVKRSVSLCCNDFRLDKGVTGRILSSGVPIAFQDGLVQVAFLIITIIVNKRGVNDAAAVGIVEKIICFIFLVPSSMLSTVSALGAQNIGAQKPERAIRTLQYALLITVVFGLAVSVIVQFVAEGAVALFTDTDTVGATEVIRLGGSYFRGYIWDCVFAGIHFCFSGYFCACGKSGLSFIHNIISIILVRIPGAYFASALFSTTLYPMGLATAAGSLVSAVICVIMFMGLQKDKKQNNG